MELTLETLHAVNPYEGFRFKKTPAHVEGWNSDEPAFAELIAEVRPALVIEVGTWLGASALHMGKLLSEQGLEGSRIVCVDTWLGSVEFWTDQTDATRYGALTLKHGYPSVYYQFLANVMHAGLERTIIPFPQASTIASAWSQRKGVQADLIYIDASHEYRDVLDDVHRWWDVVRPGGVMFGDDWHTFRDVQIAVSEFAGRRRLIPEVRGNKWILRKK